MWINSEIKPEEDNCGNFMSLNSEKLWVLYRQIYMMGKLQNISYADTPIVANEMENQLTQVLRMYIVEDSRIKIFPLIGGNMERLKKY